MGANTSDMIKGLLDNAVRLERELEKRNVAAEALAKAETKVLDLLKVCRAPCPPFFPSSPLSSPLSDLFPFLPLHLHSLALLFLFPTLSILSYLLILPPFLFPLLYTHIYMYCLVHPCPFFSLLIHIPLPPSFLSLRLLRFSLPPFRGQFLPLPPSLLPPLPRPFLPSFPSS